jgi:hypothetical protein
MHFKYIWGKRKNFLVTSVQKQCKVFRDLLHGKFFSLWKIYGICTGDGRFNFYSTRTRTIFLPFSPKTNKENH